MQVDIQLVLPSWQKESLCLNLLAFLEDSWPCVPEIPQRKALGLRQWSCYCCFQQILLTLWLLIPFRWKMGVCSRTTEHLSAIPMSLKVQGSTAAEHLSKHLPQFGGQMDKSNYLQGLLECFQPCCWLAGYPHASPSNFAAWCALILNLWGLLNQVLVKGFVSVK